MRSWNELLAYLTSLINRTIHHLLRWSRRRSGWVCLVFFFFFSSTADAQRTDSANFRDRVSQMGVVKMLQSSEHSAQKAALYSALLPGWGQAYNKKYWKVPIVWGALAGVGYFVFTNQSGYVRNKDYYITLSEYPDTTVNGYTQADLNSIYQRISEYRDARDLSVLILVAAWGLNIIDANVDGHFYNFDIDEDLSMRFSPSSWLVADRKQVYGVSLVFTLH